MEQGINFIKEFVTPVTVATYDPKNNSWFIGYKQTYGVYNGLTWSVEQVESDLRKQVRDINRFLAHNFVCLHDNQVTALISLIHDIGTEAFIASDIPAFISAKRNILAANAFMMFNKEGRSVSIKKVERRRKEQQLFTQK